MNVTYKESQSTIEQSDDKYVKSIGKKRSTSRLQPIQKVEEQLIENRYRNAPS